MFTSEGRIAALKDATRANLTKVIQQQSDERFDMVADVLEYVQFYKLSISGGSNCTYVLGQTAFEVSASGGSIVTNVETDSACPWQVIGIAPSWARWTGAGPGRGSVSITIDPNLTTARRTLTIQIAGQPVDINQQGGGVQQPPIVVSGTPSLPTGSPQKFTFVARDPNGFSEMNRVYFQFHGTPTVPVNSCHGFYDRNTAGFYLYNDSVTVHDGPLSPGSNGTLQNSQCTIHGSTSTPVSGFGTDLTVTLGVSLKGAYAASLQKVYLWVTDDANTGTGWVELATWNPIVPPNQPPIVVSGAPSLPIGSPQKFTFVARDPNGFSDMNRVYFQFHGTPTVPVNSCHGFYDRNTAGFYLYNDSVTVHDGPLSPGSNGTLQNSQCIIHGSASTPVSGFGTDLTVTLGVSLKGAYAATQQKVYLWVTDNANTGTGWVELATWKPIAQPPIVVSGAPGTTASATQSFTSVTRDPNGASDINRVYFLVNRDTSITSGSCHGFYDRASKSVFLYNDPLTSLLGPLPAPEFGPPVILPLLLSNSQCSITSASARATSDTDMVLNLSITRQGTYANGNKNLYVWVTDNANTGSGWVLISTWTR